MEAGDFAFRLIGATRSPLEPTATGHFALPERPLLNADGTLQEILHTDLPQMYGA